MGGLLCSNRNQYVGDSLSEMSEGPFLKEPQSSSYTITFNNSSLHKSTVTPLRDRAVESSPYFGKDHMPGEGHRLPGYSHSPNDSHSPARRTESGESTVPSMLPSKSRPIRWKKGEIIGSGAYGRVYMGMNLDNGELIAVKQVLIAVGGANSKKAQDHLRSLEEEVDLLRNLSHPNIVRYLGTQREEEALNIFLEFVPGGSISSLLSKFGCFTEKVIKKYTRQILLGLDYLHRHKIMHRDIKGANILVDNKGGIKLADFGASKKLADLATVSTGNRSLRGTPYWMAPEVIKQTGHGRQADIWSVGCTVLEMASGKPPWSEYQSDVAALFHIAQSESPPPIPANLSAQASDFILLCLQRDPHMRPGASDLLRHPFLYPEMDSPLTNGSSTGAAEVLPSAPAGDSTPTNRHEELEDDKLSLPRGALSMDDKESVGHYSMSQTPHSLRMSLFQQAGSSRAGNNAEVSSQWEASDPRDNFQDSTGRERRKEAFRGRARPGMGEASHASSNVSFRSDFNPMEEPSYKEPSSGQEWNDGSDDEVTGPSESGANTGLQSLEVSRFSEAACATPEEDGGSQSRGDTEGTEDRIQRFLQDKAVELKRMEELISERSDEESSMPADNWQESGSLPADSWQVGSRSVEGGEEGLAEGDSSEDRREEEGVAPLVECASPNMTDTGRRGHGFKPFFGQNVDSQAEGSGSSKKQRWEEELQSELASKRGKKKRHSSHSTESGSGSSTPSVGER